MATRRFSSEELYTLRNDIPVEKVIKNVLNIPCRLSQGRFRFLCPLCNEFNTAVNPATNLARCFCCKKNFNTIDLVMLITQSDFVHSIRLLKDYQKGIPHQTQSIKPFAKPTQKGLESIGDVLKMIKTPSVPVSQGCGSDEKSCHRILTLEKKLEDLEKRIEEIVISLA